MFRFTSEPASNPKEHADMIVDNKMKFMQGRGIDQSIIIMTVGGDSTVSGQPKS